MCAVEASNKVSGERHSPDFGRTIAYDGWIVAVVWRRCLVYGKFVGRRFGRIRRRHFHRTFPSADDSASSSLRARDKLSHLPIAVGNGTGAGHTGRTVSADRRGFSLCVRTVALCDKRFGIRFLHPSLFQESLSTTLN